MDELRGDRKVHGLNEYQRALMGKPSIESALCPSCGRVATNRHHIVPRSQGGAAGPTVCVCGIGNASGCHGLLHAHMLHLRWRDGWEYLRTEGPTKYGEALRMGGWRKVRTF